jgi:hypothetical protein
MAFVDLDEMKPGGGRNGRVSGHQRGIVMAALTKAAAVPSSQATLRLL